MKREIEPWERRKINKLTLTGVAAGCGGMLVGALVTIVLGGIGIGDGALSGLVLVIPWMVVTMLMTQIAYRQGVSDQRERSKAEADSEGGSPDAQAS